MKRSQIILIHVVFWTVYTIMPMLGFLFKEHGVRETYFWYRSAHIVLALINFYLCYVYLIPWALKKKKLGVISLIAFVFIIGFTVFRFFAIEGLYYLADLKKNCETCYSKYIWHELISSITYTFLAVLIKLTIDRFEKQQLNDKLLNQNQTSELALLKSQVSPHFLFNTLNNIYSLSIKKSEETSEAIMKLSEIMRYMLYDANVEKVRLSDEINYLKSYIELQRYRLKCAEAIRCDWQIEDENKLIAPMLLVPFVENAFKHGHKLNTEDSVQVYLKQKDNELEFSVRNQISDSESKQKDKVGGVGLKNVQRRLDLIYPSQFELKIDTQKDCFEVKLKLHL